jgi:hypothetical protein
MRHLKVTFLKTEILINFFKNSDMELITKKQAHFRQIKGLKLNNWK